MNPVVGLLLIGLIALGLLVAPNLVYYGALGLILLPFLGIAVLLVVFWWKVLSSWIKDLFNGQG